MGSNVTSEKVKKVNSKYSMAFTTCSLLHQETIKVAELYLECGDWKKVSKIAAETNLLQYRTESSLKRTISEIVSKLKLLPDDALSLMVNGSEFEQLQMLWFSTCLRYQFIYEFSIEVIRHKYSILQPELTQLDFDAFFNSKITIHEELETIAESTKLKLKQVLFKMLREAKLIDKNNIIMTALISPNVHEVIKKYDLVYLNIFPN